MRILALEFSTSRRSAAILAPRGNGAGQGEASSVFETVETGTGGTALGLVESVLKAAATERKHIDLIAVGIGPGSYTGIRAAISMAQGWQLALEVPLVPVSSALVIARQARSDGFLGPVEIVIDAQRGEYYLARYELLPEATTCDELKPLRLMARGELEERLESGAVLVGPDLQEQFPKVRPTYPAASLLAQIAAENPRCVPGDKLVPIYLREPAFVKAPPPRRVDWK